MVAAYGGRPAAEYFRVDTIARTFSRSNPLGPSRALRNFLGPDSIRNIPNAGVGGWIIVAYF